MEGRALFGWTGATLGPSSEAAVVMKHVCRVSPEAANTEVT